MLNGYGSILNFFALKSHLKIPEIPADTLCVGTDQEITQSIPNTLYHDISIPPKRIEVIPAVQLAYEKTNNGILSISDFPNVKDYFGSDTVEA